MDLEATEKPREAEAVDIWDFEGSLRSCEGSAFSAALEGHSGCLPEERGRARGAFCFESSSKL